MKHTITRRLISLALALVLLGGLVPWDGMPSFAVEAQAASTSFALTQQQLAERGVGANAIPKHLTQDDMFMDQYVRNNGTTLNINHRFSLDQGSAVNVKGADATLSNNIIRHNSSGDWSVSYSWYPNEAEKKLLQDTDFAFVNEFNVVSDKHVHNYVVSKTEHWSRVSAGLYDTTGNVLTEKDAKGNTTSWWVKNSHTHLDDQDDAFYKSVNTLNYTGDHLTFKILSQDQTCGDAQVNDTTFYFVDQWGPVLRNIDIRPVGGAYSRNISLANGNVKMQVTLEFSENIRLSDNHKNGEAITLNLAAEYGDQSGKTVGSELKDESDKLVATLVSMGEKTMTFEFTVKAELKDVVIKGLAIEQPLNESHELYLYTADGTQLTGTSLKSDHWITDMQGNPVKIYDRSIDPITLESVPPELNRIEMTDPNGGNGPVVKIPTSWDDNSTDRSAVFAGVGDTIGFQVFFNEAITNVNAAEVKAVLSINDASGDPVKLTVKKIDGERIIFNDLTITEEMTAAGVRIYITKFEGLDNLTDYAGHKCVTDLTKTLEYHDRQIHLDVDTPALSTTLTETDGTYSPLADTEGEYFTIPVKLSEIIPNGVDKNLTSGVNNTALEFVLDLDQGASNQGFQWKLDTSQAVDKTGTWNNGTIGKSASFTGVSDGTIHYLHIRLYSSTDYGYSANGNKPVFKGKVTFYGTDWAGNVDTKSYSFSHTADTEAPDARFSGSMIVTPNLDGVEPSVTFEDGYLMQDNYGLQSITVNWYYSDTGDDGTYQLLYTSTVKAEDMGSGMVKRYEGKASYTLPLSKIGDTWKGRIKEEFIAQDWSGRTDTISFVRFFNYEQPAGNYTMNIGTQSAPVELPSVTIKAPTADRSSSISGTARTLMFIQDPDDSEGYWVYDPWKWEFTTDSWKLTIPPYYHDFYKLDGFNELTGYYETEYGGYSQGVEPADGLLGRFYYVTTDGPITDGVVETSYPLLGAGENSFLRQLYNYMRTNYGTMNITMVTSYDFPWPQTAEEDKAVLLDFNPNTSSIESYTVYQISDGSTSYSVTTTGVTDATGADAEAKLKYDETGSPAADLDNVAISFQLTNTSDENANYQYGLNFLDYANSSVNLCYYGSSAYSTTGESVYSWATLPVATDGAYTFQIPEGVCAKSGWYGLEVTVKDSLGYEKTFALDKYFMDATVFELTLDSYTKAYGCDQIYYRDLLRDLGVSHTDMESMTGVPVLPLDGAPNELWTVDSALTFSRNKRDDGMNFALNESIKVRVRNVTFDAAAGLEGETGVWVNASSETEIAYTPVVTDPAAADPYGTADAPLLPMVEGYNTLVYEIVSTNGTVSTKEYVVDVVGKVLDWDLVSDIQYSDDGLVQKVTVSAAATNPGEFAPADCKFGYYNSREYFKTEYVFTDDLDETFYLLDPNGNLSVKELDLADEFGNTLDIDGEAPFVGIENAANVFNGQNMFDDYSNGTDVTSYSNMFHFIVSANDYDSPVSAKDMTIVFDDDYAAFTGVKSMPVPLALNEDGSYKMNEDGTYAVWESFDTSHNGIYRTRILHEGFYDPYPDDPDNAVYENYVSVEIWGTWAYNPNLDPYKNGEYDETVEDALPDNYILTLTAADSYGNMGFNSRTYYYQNPSYTLGTATIIPEGEYNAGYLNIDGELNPDGTVGMRSNVPLASIDGYGASAGEMVDAYTAGQWEHMFYFTAPMIVENGEYTFSVTDLFGQTYDLSTSFDALGELDILVSFSETDVTNQPVTVSAKATAAADEIVSIADDKGNAGTVDPDDPAKASITVSENCTITVKTKNGASRTVYVTNIDTVLDPVRIEYYDGGREAIDSSATSADSVTAHLLCDTEYIYTTNGKAAYTFPVGSKKGDTYTFEYADEAGNTGTVTATLPCDVVAPEPDAVDTQAPDFSVTMYAMANNRYAFVDQRDNSRSGEEINDILSQTRGQKYKLVFTINDDSDVKVVVSDTAPTDYASAVQGSTVENVELSVSRNIATVTVSENTSFGVWMIDAAGNVAALPGIEITTVDKAAPELEAVYTLGKDKDGYSVVTATFQPKNESELFEEIYPVSAGVEKKYVQVEQYDPEYGAYYVEALRYGYTFTTNGEYTFTYTDDIGNIGEVTAKVSGLSTSAAAVRSVEWFGTEGNRTPDKSAPVNRDVTAQLEMNKPISQVELLDGDGKELAADAPVSVSFTGTQINVTYKDNVGYQIVVRFTASASGRKATYTLPAVTCIDKVAPTVTLNSAVLASDKRSMSFTFTTDEATLLSQNAAEGYAEQHTWIATGNKPVQLQFSDKAGNVVEYNVTENSVVDVSKLTVSFSTGADGANATTDPLKLELDAGATVYIKVNKAASLTVDGTAAGNVEADVWTAVQLSDEAGLHHILLVDTNTGDELYALVAAQPKDNVAPIIELSSTVIVNEDASVAQMMQAINTGVTVTDNVDAGLTFQVTGYPDAVRTGLYTLEYTAEDAVGNKAVAQRSLYIMAEGTPLLKVNGEAALPYDKVMIADGDNITLEMENMSDESVIIKYRSGYRTSGQMKYYATIVENMSFSVSESGFYTIYIRTQSRVEYVTYIYVEG